MFGSYVKYILVYFTYMAIFNVFLLLKNTTEMTIKFSFSFCSDTHISMYLHHVLQVYFFSFKINANIYAFIAIPDFQFFLKIFKITLNTL